MDEASEAIRPKNQYLIGFHGILLLYYSNFQVADMPVIYGLSAVVRSTPKAKVPRSNRGGCASFFNELDVFVAPPSAPANR